MSSSVRAVLIASLLSGSLLAPVVHAEDASVKTRLDARGVKYEVDGDGDFKVTYNYSKENRSQLVFVSGTTQDVGGFKIREIFSPAARVEKDGIKGAKALELLTESRKNQGRQLGSGRRRAVFRDQAAGQPRRGAAGIGDGYRRRDRRRHGNRVQRRSGRSVTQAFQTAGRRA